MPKKEKKPAPPVLLQIEVPGPSRSGFWKRPDGKLEFWAFKDRPRAFVNERIVFTFDRQPVAEARILKIEAPGCSKCHATGQYERYHKVFWDPKKFVKYKAAAGSPAFYHLSRRTNRGSIKAKGLLPMVKEYKDLKRRPGVFLFTTFEMAEDYGFYFAQYINQAVDVWEVRLPDGYKVSPDTHPDMEGFNAWVGYDPIPTEEMKVVDTVLVPTSLSKRKSGSDWDHGYCMEWAAAYQELKGGDLYLVVGYYKDEFGEEDELAPEYAHAFVSKDGGKTGIDVRGTRPVKKIVAECAFGNEIVKTEVERVTREGLDDIGLEGLVPLAVERAKEQIMKTGADNVIDVGGEGEEEDQYWAGEGNAASGVLPVCPKKGTVCLAWRSAEVMTPNCWGTIGGAVQEGMSPQQSAKTEMAEETGYRGGVSLIAAYVFADRGFSYHNFIGVVGTEFAFHPGEEHGWETDHIAWVPYDQVVADMAKNPGDYHPGMLKLFSASGDKIKDALGIKEKPGKPELESGTGKTGSALPPELQALRDRYEAQGVTVELSSNDRSGLIVGLDAIVVPKGQRGEGIGSSFMEELVRWADAAGATLFLTPSKDFGATSVGRLRGFYGQFGFKRNMGRNKDFRSWDAMVRQPRRGKTAWQEIVHSDPKGDTTGGILENDKELAEWGRDNASTDMEQFMKALAGTKKVGVIDAMNSWFPGHGNGTEMLERFIAECKAKGCDAIILQAAVLNQQRKGFDLVSWYKSHGFYEFGYSKGIGPLMVKRLKGKNPLTEKKRKGAALAFRDENRDYHDGQSDMTLRAYDGDREVGRVEYVVYQGEPSVQWIEAYEKGKGVGPALLKELQKMFPDRQVDLGYTTDEGGKMVDKMKFREEPTEEAPLFEELKGLVKERDWLQGIADRFFEKDQHTEQEKAEFGEQMERMNAVHDRIWGLEQATYGKSPAKRLIASRINPTMLLQIAWEVRDRVIPGRDAIGGDCQEVSDAIVEELHKRGFEDAFTMHGQWEGMPQHPHAWVEVAGYQIDATRDQFAVFMDDPKRESELYDNPVLVKKAAQGQLFPDSVGAKFRSWFDGSRVVDKQGQPLPVYHGTRSSVDFQEFSVDGPPYQEDKYFEGEQTSSGSGADPTAMMGAHFAEEPHVANQFAMGEGWTRSRYEGENPMPRVLKVYLRVTNPKDFGSEHNLREFINQGKVHGDAVDLAMQHELGIDPWEADENAAAEEWYGKYDSDPAFRAEANRYLFEDHRAVEGDDSVLNDAAYDLATQARERLRTAGHDGVRYKNVVEGGHAWIVFEPTQIKSAWAAQYDQANPSITASLDKEARVDPAIKFKTEYVRPYPNPEGERMSFRVVALRGKDQVGVVGVYIGNGDEQDTARVMLADVADSDRGTGLGQALYDKAIANAKKIGCTEFISDRSMTSDAVKAWGRLSQRYPVKSEDGRYSIALNASGMDFEAWSAAVTAAVITRRDPEMQIGRPFEEVVEGQDEAVPAIALASKKARVPRGMSYLEVTGAKTVPMDADWKKRVEDTNAPALKDPSLRKLRETLISHGGEEAMVGGSIIPPEEVQRLLTRGQYWGGKATRKPGRPNNCHGNSRCLMEEGLGEVANGYALSKDGLWRAHSWVVGPGGVIETTVPRAGYFGAILTRDEVEREIEKSWY